MRITPTLFAVILSASILYHHTDALGTDSASHGLLYGGQVVRRYGNFESEKLFNKRSSVRSRGFQERAEDPADPAKGAKGAKEDAKAKNPKEDEAPKPKEPKAKPVPATDPAKDPTDTDPTTANSQDQAQAPAQPVAGGPSVPTDGMSVSAVGGLVAVGSVFALVAGLFAFSKRRKNKEMTKNIVSSSAKAWEHQNSTFEKLEEEAASPLGSYAVIATYTPTLADELDIQPGDKVTILVEFDDGWVQGINETRGGTKGVFPRHCVDMDRVISNNIHNNKRSSSIGGYSAEKYTEVDLN